MREQRSRRKKIKKFNNVMRERVFLVSIFILLVSALLVYQLAKIHQEKGEKYEKRTLSQQTYMSDPLVYRRGEILDRNNTKLATSIRVYDVIISPKDILKKDDYREPTINALVEYFELDKKELNQILTDKAESQYRKIASDISKDKVDAFNEMLEEETKRCKKAKEECNIVGIWFEKNYKRTYPLKNLACRVIGNANSSNVAAFGLELQYTDVLNGVEGRKYGYYDEDSNVVTTVKAAENGNSIVTTLDINIQSKVEKQIKKYMKKTGAKQGVHVLVMNPQNGEIYAMASDTSFDLNNAYDLSQLYSEKELKNKSEEDKSKLLSEMWKNFCVSDSYEPGSPFKTLTVASALEEGITKDGMFYTCDGGELFSGMDKPIKCVSTMGHGPISLEQSLMKSCNDVMMQLARKMGRTTFAKYQNIFNMGKKTGIDLPAETTGLVHSEEKLNVTELATSSFGQGMTVNMVQIASAVSSIINGGNYYKPHLVKEIIDEDGNTVKRIEPTLVRKTISEQTSSLLRKYMKATVDDGTAGEAKIKGYSIGGKTGTAEKKGRDKTNYLVSFIGASPMDDPEVVVYVIVDEPNVADQAHSTYAQEIAKGIMKDIFPYLGIYPDESVQKKNKQTATPATTPETDPNTGETENNTGQPEEGGTFETEVPTE